MSRSTDRHPPCRRFTASILLLAGYEQKAEKRLAFLARVRRDCVFRDTGGSCRRDPCLRGMTNGPPAFANPLRDDWRKSHVAALEIRNTIRAPKPPPTPRRHIPAGRNVLHQTILEPLRRKWAYVIRRLTKLSLCANRWLPANCRPII